MALSNHALRSMYLNLCSILNLNNNSILEVVLLQILLSLQAHDHLLEFVL